MFDIEIKMNRSEAARKAANARHDAPGGSREKRRKMREAWATGKHKSRWTCAREMHTGLRMSYGTARKALTNTPDPCAVTKNP